jgi:hypothetical protein
MTGTSRRSQLVVASIERPFGSKPVVASENTTDRRNSLMILQMRYLLGILATVGATYAAPVLFHFLKALSLVQIG